MLVWEVDLDFLPFIYKRSLIIIAIRKRKVITVQKSPTNKATGGEGANKINSSLHFIPLKGA